MNPQLENQPTVQMPQKSHKRLALVLIIAPTALFILALILVMIASQMGNDAAQGDLFGESSPVKQTLNVLSFLAAIIGFISWLPGLIIGIVLLAKKR